MQDIEFEDLFEFNTFTMHLDLHWGNVTNILAA